MPPHPVKQSNEYAPPPQVTSRQRKILQHSVRRNIHKYIKEMNGLIFHGVIVHALSCPPLVIFADILLAILDKKYY